MHRGLAFGVIALAVFLAGCKPGPEAGPVKVWADPALKAALEKLAPQLRKHHPEGWEMEYKESAAIARLSAADLPDVVLTVEPVAQELLKGGQLDESTMRTFAGDLLAVVTPRAKPLDLPKLGDLVVTHFNKIGVGSKDTSEGYYAKQALIADGAMARVKDQIKEYGSVDELVDAVGSGTIDFGLVYASTAAQHKELAVATTIPEDLYQDIRYTAVATKVAAGNHGVVELLKLLAEDPEGQKVFGSFGFVDRATAMQETK